MTNPTSLHSQDSNHSRMKRLLVIIRSNLIAGLLVAGPVYATILILNWVYTKIDPPVQRFLLRIMQVNVLGPDLDGKPISAPGDHRVHDWPIFPDGLPTWLSLNYISTDESSQYQVIFGLGLLLTFLLLLLVGFLTRTILGRYLIDLLDASLNRIPVVNTIYSSIKKLSDTMFGKKSAAEPQKEVVLIEYPGPGSAAVGFVTGIARGHMQVGAVRLFNEKIPSTPSAESPLSVDKPKDAAGEEMLLIFLPMAPLPTGGFLIVVPRSRVVKLDITVEQAFQMIVSGGILQPNGQTDDTNHATAVVAQP